MLEIKNVCLDLAINDRNLVDDFSLVLNPGDKAVIIGEEGNGKSTLLKFIYDESLVDGYCNYSGQIIKKGTVAYLPQMFIHENHELTIEEFFDNKMGTDSAQIVARLGIPIDLTTSSQCISTLSGGEKIKIQLAKILLTQPDILLLDEPTNDIDLPTLEWLENFISSCRQPIIFISHDETLIERTANVIIHMEQLMRKTKSKITVSYSNYEKYIKIRNQAFDKQMQIAKKQRSDHKAQMARWQQIHDRVDHEQSSVSCQDPSTGRLLKKKMKAVKSTGRRLEKQSNDFLEIPDMEAAILTQFDQEVLVPQGKVIISLEMPGLYINDRELSGPLALKINGPQRIGIVGQNGVGKSTFLKKIWETLSPRKDITVAYMPQNYVDILDEDLSPIGYLAADGHKNTTTKVRTYLGSMKFTSDEMLGKISKLSGGQKAKVLFLDMVLKKANVLVLDEPTRNFSPLSAPEIRKTLTNFGGAIISVSHDRKYPTEVCDQIYELTTNGLTLAAIDA